MTVINHEDLAFVIAIGVVVAHVLFEVGLRAGDQLFFALFAMVGACFVVHWIKE